MSKVTDKLSSARAKVADKLPGSEKSQAAKSLRITNDTIEAHREKILAGGRKFKYPFQFSKHKILLIAVAIIVAAAVAFGIFLWQALYKTQQTSDFYYSATKVLPLPVAKVNGQTARYDDYLRRVRADMFYKIQFEKRDFSSQDGQAELNYIKRQELNTVEQAAYAASLAKKYNVSVTDQEVSDEVAKSLVSSSGAKISEADYERNTLKAYYNWTMQDFRDVVRDQLLERKVAFAVDDVARAKVAAIQKKLQSGADFTELAKTDSDDDTAKLSGGIVSVGINDLDTNGLAVAARKLSVGAVSEPIQGVDGYYLVKLLEKTDETTKYAMIKTNLNQFNQDFAKLQKSGKITEYIKVDK
jgi:parvulin-like peptidyl-prolyl isomerase